MTALSKRDVVEALRKTIADRLRSAAQMTADARAEATAEESRAENKYDTRATEASYLAAGQGRRLESLRTLAAWLEGLDPQARHAEVGVGALVGLTEPGRPPQWVLVGPTGGPSVEVDGQTVLLSSLASPLGEALDEAEAGDGIEVDSPRGIRRLRVDQVW
ncbi:MAG: transcription elongation factor GreAB [Myxococcota bacterium]